MAIHEMNDITYQKFTW